MPGEKKPELSLEQQVTALKSDLANAWWQIHNMQKNGGFTDSKTHSVRATRLEDRVEKLELQSEALLDIAAFSVTMMEDHLRDRHDCDIDRDSAIDATNWRRIRRRLREMAEKLGMTGKRRDVTNARNDENRLRPHRQPVPA